MIGLIGSTGRIGRHVAAALAGGPDAVVALTRDVADLRDPGAVRAALDGVQRLMLLTPHGPDQDLLEAVAIDAAVAAGVRRIVKLSGGAASLGPDGPTSTAVAHWRGERRIEATGLDFVFVRPTFLMQNLLATAAPTVAGAGLLAAPMGRAPIAMVDARDVAACLVAGLRADGAPAAAWSVTGPRGVSFDQLGRLLGVTYLNVSSRAAARALRRQGADAWEVDHALRMAAFLGAGAAAATTPTVQQVTGHAPRSIEAFLDEHRAVFAGRRPIARVLRRRPQPA